MSENAISSRWSRREKIGFAALLVAAACVYFINLTVSGYANEFYSAAIQAGSVSWKAFLFGSSDAANSITVDKPPASLWASMLLVRVFGLSSFTILAPYAAMGVGTIATLYRIVRRHFAPGAAFAASIVLLTTPVAAMMFRFNNPDALLVLLMVLATGAVLRAVEDGRTRWMVLAGVALGFGFLTKQLQAFLILPGLGLVYLCCAPVSLRRRLRDAALGILALMVSAGWWVALVELLPASMRPYVGGSQSNSFLELTFSYNGLGRLTGAETGSVTMNGASMWGETGLSRLFGSEFAGQITWLAPAAAILLVTGLVLTRRAARTDLRRAHLLAWGSWLVVTWLVFSYMSGIFHAYYTVALAPAIAALVGVGGWLVWERRAESWTRILAAVLALVCGAWALHVLAISGASLWLRWPVLLLSIAGAGALGLSLADFPQNVRRRLTVLGAALSLVAALLTPSVWTVYTMAEAHTGSLPTAGPSSSGSPSGMPGGNAGPGGGGSTGRGPGGGGPGDSGAEVSDELTSLLSEDADAYTWVAATSSTKSAASYQLATEEPVMGVGGYNGTDPSPTLEQFQEYVEQGQIHYYISGGSMRGQATSGSSDASEIAQWVEENYTATTVDGVTVYDLTE